MHHGLVHTHPTHKSHHPLCGVLLLLFSNGTNCGWFVVHGQGARCDWSSITKHHIHTTTTMQHTWCGCGDDQCDLLLVPHHHHNHHPPMHPHLLVMVMASDQPPKRVQPSMSTLNASTHGSWHSTSRSLVHPCLVWWCHGQVRLWSLWCCCFVGVLFVLASWVSSETSCCVVVARPFHRQVP